MVIIGWIWLRLIGNLVTTNSKLITVAKSVLLKLWPHRKANIVRCYFVPKCGICGVFSGCVLFREFLWPGPVQKKTQNIWSAFMTHFPLLHTWCVCFLQRKWLQELKEQKQCIDMDCVKLVIMCGLQRIRMTGVSIHGCVCVVNLAERPSEFVGCQRDREQQSK